jgi:hypothetical protein
MLTPPAVFAAPVATRSGRVGPRCVHHGACRYDACPIGICQPVVESEVAPPLLDTRPPAALCQSRPPLGHTYAHSESKPRDPYHACLRSCQVGRNCSPLVKQPRFMQAGLDTCTQPPIARCLRGRPLQRLHHFVDRARHSSKVQGQASPAAGRGCRPFRYGSTRRICP